MTTFLVPSTVNKAVTQLAGTGAQSLTSATLPLHPTQQHPVQFSFMTRVSLRYI
jgi:hypothetical protein